MSTLPPDPRPAFAPQGGRDEYSQRHANTSVSRSETQSRFRSQYGEIEMEIDIVISACTNKRNYLHHPNCEAPKVAKLIRQGYSTTAIARELGVSTFIVGKVTKFLDMEPNPDRIDYLDHPRCNASRAMEFRQQGLTFEEIGEHFGVSHEIVRKVLRTLCERQGIPMPPAKDPRGRSRFKIQAIPQ